MENVIIDSKSKRKRVENFVVIGLILVVAIVLGVKINLNAKVAKENALMSELRVARTAVQLYVVVNKSLPPDLKTLVTQKYTLRDKQGTYLTGLRVDKDNQPMDSFGNKFNYDAKSGRVWSATNKYGNW